MNEQVHPVDLEQLRAQFTDFLSRKAGLAGELEDAELDVLKLGSPHRIFRFTANYRSVTGKDKQIDWVLKLHGDTDIRPAADSAVREFYVLQFLREREYPVPLAWSVELDPDVLDSPFVVMDYIEGEKPDLRPGLSDRFGEVGLTRTYQLALQLTHLHHFENASNIELHWPELDDELSFAAVIGDIAEGYRGNDAYTPLHPWCEWIGDNWEDHPCQKYALLHTQFRPDNVLLEGKVVKAVLDWGDSLTGDPLFDLATSELHLRVFFSEVIAAKFAESYREQREAFRDPEAEEEGLNFYRVAAGLRFLVEQINRGVPADEEHIRRAVEFTCAICGAGDTEKMLEAVLDEKED